MYERKYILGRFLGISWRKSVFDSVNEKRKQGHFSKANQATKFFMSPCNVFIQHMEQTASLSSHKVTISGI